MRPVRSSVFSAVFACTASVLATAPAQAGFNATFTGADPSAGTFAYTARGTSHSSLAGRMNWTATTAGPTGLLGMNGQSGNGFITFCIEVSQHVTSNHSYTLDPQALHTLPNSGAVTPMNSNKANDVAQFWARWASDIAALQPTGSRVIAGFNGGNAVYQDVIGSAIQLAIWEIVFEKDYSTDGTVATYTAGHYDVTTEAATNGGFVVTGGKQLSRDLANHMLSLVDFNGGAAANVIGFKVTNGMNHHQDQVGLLEGPNNLVPTPAPAAVVLALTGLVPCVVFRRRLAGRPAAN